MVAQVGMEAVIFDMDGTMIDNMMVHHRAWQKTMSLYGHEYSLEEVHKEFHGVNTEILERLFGDTYSHEERMSISREKEKIYQQEYRPHMKLIPGLDIFLSELAEQGIPVALASAAPAENVSFVLQTLSLSEIFSSILHAGDVRMGKPDPEIYIRTAEILGKEPDRCLVFEDSPAGAIAASAAGCALIVVTTTHSRDDFNGITGIRGFVQDYNDPLIRELNFDESGLNS